MKCVKCGDIVRIEVFHKPGGQKERWTICDNPQCGHQQKINKRNIPRYNKKDWDR